MRVVDEAKIPGHVAIIMDGNGRWARKRALDRIEGHRKGLESVREVVTACRELGIKILTLYAFSSENWNRPRREIRALMGLLKRYLRGEVRKMVENEIRFNVIGNVGDLPDDVKKVLADAGERTKGGQEMLLNVALSYSGRSEILQAIRRLARAAVGGRIIPDRIDEELFSEYLYTSGLADPDLLIRTSGELRISNFLLWQMAYTEIYVTDVLWPDFRRSDLIRALKDYQKRERRFGLTHEQIERK
jgi:undecaprenyl diphosphate synthase